MYFVNLLNKLRVGRPLTLEEEDNLLSHPLSFDAKTALRIYPFRAKVDAFNESKLQTLTSAQRVYGCMDSYVWFEDKHPDLEDHFRRLIEGDTNSPFSFFSRDRHRYAEEVAIKEGMPVVLLRNLDFSAGLVNGSRGHVVGLESVKLADFSGQKFNKLDYILAVGGAKTKHEEEEVIKLYHSIYQKDEIGSFARSIPQTHEGWPIVRFENGEERTIFAHCSITELGSTKPYSLISRTQLPLIAGWAITIHKSQGMTIDKAVVDVDGAWEQAQVYVAMSRVKSLDGLLVSGLSAAQSMRADPTVTEFMRSFRSSEGQIGDTPGI